MQAYTPPAGCSVISTDIHKLLPIKKKAQAFLVCSSVSVGNVIISAPKLQTLGMIDKATSNSDVSYLVPGLDASITFLQNGQNNILTPQNFEAYFASKTSSENNISDIVFSSTTADNNVLSCDSALDTMNVFKPDRGYKTINLL